MSEQEHMDTLLSQALSAPVPELSPAFERELTERLRPRKLSARGRTWLILYATFALVVSIGVMRQASIDWALIAASVAVPLVVVAIVLRRRVRRPLSRMWGA